MVTVNYRQTSKRVCLIWNILILNSWPWSALAPFTILSVANNKSKHQSSTWHTEYLLSVTVAVYCTEIRLRHFWSSTKRSNFSPTITCDTWAEGEVTRMRGTVSFPWLSLETAAFLLAPQLSEKIDRVLGTRMADLQITWRVEPGKEGKHA